jgi:hypothetical protein
VRYRKTKEETHAMTRPFTASGEYLFVVASIGVSLEICERKFRVSDFRIQVFTILQTCARVSLLFNAANSI